MTDWTHYNASKYAAKCCYCNRDIHTSEGRWVAPHEDGTKGRFNACHNCIAPPQTGVSASPPPKPSSVPSSNPEPTVEKPVVVPSSTTSFTPISPIAKAHEDNMLSYELTRVEMRALTQAIRDATNAICERTRVLVTQLEGDSKGGKQ